MEVQDVSQGTAIIRSANMHVLPWQKCTMMSTSKPGVSWRALWPHQGQQLQAALKRILSTRCKPMPVRSKKSAASSKPLAHHPACNHKKVCKVLKA